MTETTTTLYGPGCRLVVSCPDETVAEQIAAVLGIDSTPPEAADADRREVELAADVSADGVVTLRAKGTSVPIAEVQRLVQGEPEPDSSLVAGLGVMVDSEPVIVLCTPGISSSELAAQLLIAGAPVWAGPPFDLMTALAGQGRPTWLMDLPAMTPLEPALPPALHRLTEAGRTLRVHPGSERVATPERLLLAATTPLPDVHADMLGTFVAHAKASDRHRDGLLAKVSALDTALATAPTVAELAAAIMSNEVTPVRFDPPPEWTESTVSLRLGSRRAQLNCRGAASVEILLPVLAQLIEQPTDQTPAPDESLTVEHRRRSHLTAFLVTGGGEPDGDFTEPELMIDNVVWRLNRRSYDGDPHHAHLHSAAVTHGSHAVVLMGESGSGKSTLTGELLLDGWGYLSDEMVALDSSGRALPYPKPLTLKPGSIAHFASRIPACANRSDPRLHVPASEFGASRAAPATEVHLVIAVTYDPEADGIEFEPMTAPQRLAHLCENLFDGERMNATQWDVLARVAANSDGGFLRHDGQLDVSRWLKNRLSLSTQPVPCATQWATGGHGPWEPVASAHFGDGGGVLLHHDTNQIAVLSAEGHEAWRNLIERPGEALTTQQSEFIEQLQSLLTRSGEDQNP